MGIVPHVHPERHLLRRYRVAFRHYSIVSWVLFCAEKNKKQRQKRMDGWSSKMRHRREIVSFFNRSINQRVFFCVCARFVCVCFGLCRFLVRVLYIEKKESVPPENVGTRWDVTTFHKASSFYASSSSSSSFLRFWKFPPRFSRRLRRLRRRRGAKRPRRRLERVLAPFREVRRRF